MSLEAKIRFLSSPEAYSQHPATVVVRETRMSWVFMTGSRVYKLKKPVRRPYLDFSTLPRRRRNCAVELRLNRRLASDVYLRVLALRRTRDGNLTLAAQGEPVEWLLEMRQLPAANMLDERICEGRLGAEDIVSLAERLAAFYRDANPEVANGGAYLRHIRTESEINRQILLGADAGMEQTTAGPLLDRADLLFRRWSPAVAERIAAGRIVEGHGDLRPEHVSLDGRPNIIDCLEFNRDMRLLDPYDEVNYLGLECEMLGAGWVGPLLLDIVAKGLGNRPDARLIAFYGTFRCLLRTRLCITHMRETSGRTADWSALAHRYLALAEIQCVKAEG